MAKVDPNFKHDAFKFIHRPIREADRKLARQFLERFVHGFQRQFEKGFETVDALKNLHDPALTEHPRVLKDIVGLDAALDNITDDISDADLRRLIRLAVPLWKQKGQEIGYENIIRLFTGKNSRSFNWFHYRFILGETIFEQEGLGRDAWLISDVGVTASKAEANTLVLLRLENNFQDESGNETLTELHGHYHFYERGPILGSSHYLDLQGSGVLRMAASEHIDFNSGFTVEFYFKTGVSQSRSLYSTKSITSQITIYIDTDANQILFLVLHPSQNIFESITVSGPMTDDQWRHIALVYSKDLEQIRLYYNGSESSAAISTSAIGDIAGFSDHFLGGASIGSDQAAGSFDNFRISKGARYDVTQPSLPPPGVQFSPERAEELDEFFTDIRVVDDGNLNRTLVKRILNLMRPPSERLRIVYIRFFVDFEFGKEGLRSVTTGASVDLNTKKMILPPLAVEALDIDGAETQKDLVLSVKFRILLGNRFVIRFNARDLQNFYYLTFNTSDKVLRLFKKLAGTDTLLASSQRIPIYNQIPYNLSVATDLNTISGLTTISVLLDGNQAISILDDVFNEGYWAVESSAATTSEISEIEMFNMPLSTDLVLPNTVI